MADDARTRMRRLRQRRSDGRVVLRIEVDAVGFAEAARETGFLPRAAGDEQPALQAALQRIADSLVLVTLEDDPRDA